VDIGPGFFGVVVEQFVNPGGGCVAGAILALALAPTAARRWWPGIPAWVDWAAIVAAVVAVATIGPVTLVALDVWDGGWRAVLSAALVVVAVWRIIAIHPRLAGWRTADYYVSAALAAVALASFTQLFPMLCRRHVFWAFAPALGVAVYALWRATRSKPTVLAGALALGLVPGAWAICTLGMNTIRSASVPLWEPAVLRGIRVYSTGRAQALGDMADILRRMEQADPSRPFTMIGKDALPLACVRNRRNLTPMYVTWPGLMSAEQEARWSAGFDQERPFLILQAVSLESRSAFMAEHAYRLVGEIPTEHQAFLAPAESAVTAGP